MCIKKELWNGIPFNYNFCLLFSSNSFLPAFGIRTLTDWYEERERKKIKNSISPYLDSGYPVIHSTEEAEVIGLLLLIVPAGFSRSGHAWMLF
ncbi:hypothetical protein NPIL_332931 [Nephila pilipes]|uniref:Uncharacterized protein n=1 Tax=Nephila pilipes TaxID=299642 RepID=A0A8X6PGK1_NEPPI|nr:hypothetical protein NPIL_332931 [Nephila pilipes]